MNELIVDQESLLYDYLRKNVKGSKNNIKALLTKEMITVNGKTVTKYNYELKKGDKIKIGAKKIESSYGNISIIYEDKDFLVVDKKSGILTIATEEDKNSTNNLYSILLSYMKKRNSNSKLFVVHRLDKDTSGVVLFVKNKILQEKLQENWNTIAKRIYYAVVNGITKKEETLTSYLKEDDNLMTHKSDEKNGKLSITKYKMIKHNDNYSLLEIEIKTGRRNQIRVQLKDINHPLVGDSKYGKDKKNKRLMLHASLLTIKNPLNNKEYTFESKLDKSFYDFVK
ncbi:MAG: RluA family pseudouridine synthase [Bacilli bacterium]|nr:RluA family pseudouridine synthase [Bacilli bacterium]